MADRPNASRNALPVRRTAAIIGFLILAGVAGALIFRMRSPDQAPVITYSGAIRDATTRQPLTNATVELIIASATITQTSDSEGRYLLLLPPGQRPAQGTLRVVAPGYTLYEHVLTLSATSAELADVQLVPTAALAAPPASPTVTPAVIGVAESTPVAPPVAPEQIYPNGGPLPTDLPPLNRERIAQIQERVRWGRGWASDLAFSPDGQLLAVFTQRGVYIHTVPSMAVLQIIPDYTLTSDLAFSPDNTLLALGGDDRITLWDVESGQPRQTINEPIERVRALAFSPDGRLLVSGSRDTAIRVWSVPDLKLQQTFEKRRSQEGIERLAFSPDGTRLLSGAAEEEGEGMNTHSVLAVIVWDMALGQPIGRAALPDRPCNPCMDFDSLGFSADGLTYTVVVDDRLFQWETATGDLLQQHDLDIVNAHTALGAAGGFVVAGGDGPGLVLVRIDDGERSELPPDSIQPLPWEQEIAVAVSPDGRTIASITDYANTVNLWDIEQGGIVHREAYGRRVEQAALSTNGRTLAIQTGSNTLLSWSLPDGAMRPANNSRIDYSFDQLALSADGERAITNGYGVQVWDLADGTHQQLLKLQDTLGAPAENGPIALAPDGDTLFVVSESGSLQVWDTRSGALARTVELAGTPDSLMLSPDGATLISVRGGRSIAFDTATFEQRYTIEGAAMAFSGDGRVLAGQSNVSTIQVWDATTGQARGRVSLLATEQQVIALSPDGALLASGSRQPGGLTIWDTATGTLVRTLSGSEEWIDALMFSADGSYLISASHGILQFWY